MMAARDVCSVRTLCMGRQSPRRAPARDRALARVWHVDCALHAHPAGVPRTIHNLEKLSEADRSHIEVGLARADNRQQCPEGVAPVIPEVRKLDSHNDGAAPERLMTWWDSIPWQDIRAHDPIITMLPRATSALFPNL